MKMFSATLFNGMKRVLLKRQEFTEQKREHISNKETILNSIAEGVNSESYKGNEESTKLTNVPQKQCFPCILL
jgi:hypothetical protein